MELKRTKLYDTHVALSGRMVEFAGWELPVQYPTGPTVEHEAVRTAAGLFDIDHMGQFMVIGEEATPFLNHMVTWDVSNMKDGEAHYSLLCYEDGGIVDDIFIYRRGDGYMVVVNASNRDKDFKWFSLHTGGYNVTVTDVSDETYMLALQGPKAETVLNKLLPNHDAATMAFHTSRSTSLNGIPTLIGRTGYTGEDGFELFFSADEAVRMWNMLLEAGKEDGLIPCGLAARDSLRFEPCLPLYGDEIFSEIDPISARLGFFVSFEKDFIAKNALLKIKLEGPTQKLIGFEMVERGVPRHGYAILSPAGEKIGFVTTGMKAPTAGKFVGLGYVQSSYTKYGTEIAIEIRGKAKKAVVRKRPFYIPAYRRAKK